MNLLRVLLYWVGLRRLLALLLAAMCLAVLQKHHPTRTDVQPPSAAVDHSAAESPDPD